MTPFPCHPLLHGVTQTHRSPGPPALLPVSFLCQPQPAPWSLCPVPRALSPTGVPGLVRTKSSVSATTGPTLTPVCLLTRAAPGFALRVSPLRRPLRTWTAHVLALRCLFGTTICVHPSVRPCGRPRPGAGPALPVCAAYVSPSAGRQSRHGPQGCFVSSLPLACARPRNRNRPRGRSLSFVIARNDSPSTASAAGRRRCPRPSPRPRGCPAAPASQLSAPSPLTPGAAVLPCPHRDPRASPDQGRPSVSPVP